MHRHFLYLFVALIALALLAPAAAADTRTDMQAMLDSLNLQLEVMGSDLRVHSIEWLTDPASGEMGSVVFANDRGNKQLDAHWVPADSRRSWNPGSGSITYLVDLSAGATDDGLSSADTEAAIDRAASTWSHVDCSGTLDLVKVADPGVDPSVIDGLLGFGGFGTPFADVTHAGWVPAGIFSPNTLGITFTLTFAGGDSNGDGKEDVAIREVYYNDAFAWSIGSNVDVETVALHESGHSLSLAHFGKIFGTTANGALHFAPQAVMNAAYTGIQQELLGTDEAGHCSLWATWPDVALEIPPDESRFRVQGNVRINGRNQGIEAEGIERGNALGLLELLGDLELARSAELLPWMMFVIQKSGYQLDANLGVLTQVGDRVDAVLQVGNDDSPIRGRMIDTVTVASTDPWVTESRIRGELEVDDGQWELPFAKKEMDFLIEDGRASGVAILSGGVERGNGVEIVEIPVTIDITYSATPTRALPARFVGSVILESIDLAGRYRGTVVRAEATP